MHAVTEQLVADKAGDMAGSESHGTPTSKPSWLERRQQRVSKWDRPPDPHDWRMPNLDKRWMFRVLAFGSVKVMEAVDKNPEQAYPIFGLNLIAGYHITRTHVLSGGIELLDDRYFKECF